MFPMKPDELDSAVQACANCGSPLPSLNYTGTDGQMYCSTNCMDQATAIKLAQAQNAQFAP